MGAGAADFIVRPEGKWDSEAWSRFSRATVGTWYLQPTATQYAVFVASASGGPIMVRDVVFSTDTALKVSVESTLGMPSFPSVQIASLAQAAEATPDWVMGAGLSSSAGGDYGIAYAFLPAGWFGSLFGALRLFLNANTSLMVLTSPVAANVSCGFHVYSTGV